MIINCDNIGLLDDIYVHDSIFESISYLYDEKSLCIVMKNQFVNKRYRIEFKQVKYISMQMLQLWGCGDTVVGWYSSNIDNMVEGLKYNQYFNERQMLQELTDQISIVIQMSSGDEMYVVCDSIYFLEDKDKE